MTPKKRLKHGNEFPFDAPDEWWNGDSSNGKLPPAPRNIYHAAARGVIAELQDRSGIGHVFDNIDEDVRQELTAALAAIIKAGVQDASI